MRETKSELQQTVRTFTTGVTCDLCGREAERPSDDRRLWTGDSFDVETVTIKHETGESYPEGSRIETTEYDVCPECWRTKIVPVFEAAGAKPAKSEIRF